MRFGRRCSDSRTPLCIRRAWRNIAWRRSSGCWAARGRQPAAGSRSSSSSKRWCSVGCAAVEYDVHICEGPLGDRSASIHGYGDHADDQLVGALEGGAQRALVGV